MTEYAELLERLKSPLSWMYPVASDEDIARYRAGGDLLAVREGEFYRVFMAAHEAADAITTLLVRAEKAEKALAQWEDAAKGTDIYDYLQDALKRMGTVGPKGIRQMVAYCAGLMRERDELKEALQEADKHAVKVEALLDKHVSWNGECPPGCFAAVNLFNETS